MTSSTPAAKQPFARVLLRRTLIALVVMLLILVPSFGLFALTGQPVMTYAGLGTLVGIFAVMAGGFRIGVVASIVVTLIAPLAVVAGLSPVTGAALMALMTLMVGRMSRFGLHNAVLLIPIMVAWPMLTPVPWLPQEILHKANDLLAHAGLNLSQAINKASELAASAGGSSSGSSGSGDAMAKMIEHLRSDTNYLLWVAAAFFIGAIIPVLILPLLTRKMKTPVLTTYTRREAMPYTVIIVVLTTVATYYLLDHPKMVGGSFLIATILVLTQIGTGLKWKLTLQRVLGTIAGVLLMWVITLVVGKTMYVQFAGVPLPLNLYLIGIVFGALAVISKFSPRQWIYYIFIAPATACLNAFTFTDANSLGEQRLVDNLVGAGLVIAASLIALGAGRIAGKNRAEEPADALPQI